MVSGDPADKTPTVAGGEELLKSSVTSGAEVRMTENRVQLGFLWPLHMTWAFPRLSPEFPEGEL